MEKSSRGAGSRAAFRPGPSLDAEHIGRPPAEVLAAVHADQLARHARRVEQEPQGRADLGGVRPALQHGRGALAGEMRLGLTCAAQLGPGPMALTRTFGASPCAAVRVSAHNPILAIV